MPVLRVVILWHQHQPFYKDLLNGQYRLPWVRMHALKDYYGMVKLLDEFPDVHQTFNLVPSLIAQIEDYVAGTAHDPFLNIAAKPSSDLNAEERRFALQYLFQANPTHMIGRYPRYRELFERWQNAGHSDQAQNYFHAQDFTDLQVLSQIAWFDEFFLDEPEIAELIQKGRNYSQADQQFVVSHQRELLARVLPAHADAAKKGSIELSTSPFYHPILPLVCDTNIGGISTPGLPLPQNRFQHPEDARDQLLRGLELHEKTFGIRPRGVWPSEGSVSEEALALAHSLGVQWMATDEGVLSRTLGTHFSRDGNGQLPESMAEKLYTIHRYESGDTQMHLIFRDHTISDLIGFVYSGMPPQEAANHLMHNIQQAAQPVLSKGKDALVSIILDGENAWEYFPQSGREFLRRFYDRLQNEPGVEAVTVSEAITRQQNFNTLKTLVPGSWINANFNVWIGAPEDNLAWDYLYRSREFYSENAPHATEAQRQLAYEELLIAEGSDWNWWYGPEHHSANDRDFDELYRKHLSNVYHALEAIPPEELNTPIGSGIVRPSYIPQTAYVRARVDGRISGYFEWMGAASYTSDQRTSAMHGKQFLLDAVYAGLDADSVSGRLDFHHGVPQHAYRLVVNLEVWRAADDHKTAPASYRLTVDAEGREVGGWTLQNGRESALLASSKGDPGGIEVALDEIFEMRVPFALIGAEEGSRVRLRFSIWREHLPVDSLPLEGWIDLHALAEEELETNLYSYSPPE